MEKGSELQAESYLDELLKLNKNAVYRMTKILSKRPNSFVSSGNTVTGLLHLVELYSQNFEEDNCGVRVVNDSGYYIRTSRVLSIRYKDSKNTLFETEGGVYLLEELD